MFRISWPLRRALALGRTEPVGFGRAHLRRDIGMDDWEGSIGTADPDRLWPLPRERRPISPRNPGRRRIGGIAGPRPGARQV